MTNYYVYYRVDAARLATLRGEVKDLLKSIELHSGIKGRWMQRRDQPTTCMEVYEGVEDETAFDALLEREASKLKLDRHVERFVCA